MPTKRQRSRTGRPMARGRHDAHKKSETSSSVDKGWACVLHTKMKNRDLIVGIFNHQYAVDMHFMGGLPRRLLEKWPALNAGGRLSSLQQKTPRPRARGHPAQNPSLRQHPCWLGRVFCLRSAPFSVHGVPITGGSCTAKYKKNRASNEALFF